jgi:hypothetical protein
MYAYHLMSGGEKRAKRLFNLDISQPPIKNNQHKSRKNGYQGTGYPVLFVTFLLITVHI